MRLLFAVAACVCLAGVAQAQPPQTPDKSQHEDKQSGPKPHVCDDGYFPPEALAENRQGTSHVMFTITEQGTVANPQIYRSAGHEDLDRAALACVKSWRYHPAMQNGRPVAVPWHALVVWTIPEGDGGNNYVIAWRNLRADGLKCVRHSDFARTLPPDFETIVTVFIRFPWLSSPKVEVEQPSGNPGFDKVLVDCLLKSPWLQVADKASGYSPGGTSRFAWYPGLAQ